MPATSSSTSIRFYARAVEHRDAGRQNIIVVSEIRPGSSREHAAMCPMYLGVRLVVAKGFERIHQANLINFGILPCCLPTHPTTTVSR